MFTEINPDKGTETIYMINIRCEFYRLQKLTPIRGRKLVRLDDAWMVPVTTSLQKLTPIRGRKPDGKGEIELHPSKLFTEVNPDKGTKTLISFFVSFIVTFVYRS